MRVRFLLILLLCCPCLIAADILQLPIGDPARKDRRVSLALDAITDTRTGQIIAIPELVTQLESVSILFVGENHTSLEVHRIQRRIIQALADSGRAVSIGLEMFPYTQQEHLEHWNRGFLTESGFVSLAGWYTHWGYDWRYYRSIFLTARERHIPMFAVNTPRSIVTAVRTKGFDGLSEEERSQIPETIDTSNAEHLRLFKAYFVGEDEDEEEEVKKDKTKEEEKPEPSSFHNSLSEEQWEGMFNAQCTWDASMAYHATKALENSSQQNPIMVVLIGAGHVAYGLGIERQAAQWFDGKMASLIPLSLQEGEEAAPEVQASYANYLWGYPTEPYTAYPSLGISTHTDKESGRLKILFVQDDSVAARSGLKSGDQLISIEGHELTHKSELNRILGSKSWGDSLPLVISREGETQEVIIYFRRELAEQ